MFVHYFGHEWRLTTATCLTLFRLILTPYIVSTIIYGQWAQSCIFLVMASVTDFCDGMYARFFNEQTRLGACLDPLADKILILSSFYALFHAQTHFIAIPSWFLALVIAKDIVMICGAILLCYFQGTCSIRPVMVGKATAALQLFLLMLIIVLNWYECSPVHYFDGIFIFVGLCSIFCLSLYVGYALRLHGIARGSF